MAAELASGYVTLTVKLAKDGMAEVTKEVKKAGQEGGTAYSDEFNKKVEQDVGKKIPETVGKATKDTGSGGIRKAAKDAAEEFGKGFIQGVQTEILRGDIGNVLQPINDKVKATTDLIKNIGGAAGIDTSGIDAIGNKVTTVLGNVETEIGKAGQAFGDLGRNIEDIAKKGEGGRFENLAGRVGLVADAINAINDIKAQSEDWNTWAEEHISWYKWMNQYTPDKIALMARERWDAFYANITGQGGPSGPATLGPGGTPVPAGQPTPGPNPLTVFAPTGPGPAAAAALPGPTALPGQKPTVGGGAAGPIGPTNQGAFIGGGGSGIPAAVAPSAYTTPLMTTGLGGNVYDLNANKAIVHQAMLNAGFPESDFGKLDYIIMHESHYDPKATNPATGDFGIPQFNPSAGKGTVSGTLADYLPSYSTDPATQAAAMMRYIRDRYGTIGKAYEKKVSTGIYDQGGALPPGQHWIVNNTGELELVLNSDQAQAVGLDPSKPPDQQIDSGRTAGFTPVSNTGGVPGTSSISKFLQLGNEAVGGLIDIGAQAAKAGISAGAAAGTFGAGAAAGPAAGIGIDIASSIAKRGASYGFQMLGIGADALIENLFSPFGGAPRWIGYDYTKFAPSIDPLMQAGKGAVQKAIQPQSPFAGAKTSGSVPTTKQTLPGQQGVGQPTPSLGQNPQNQNDWFSLFGFDNGGWFPANSMGVNTTGRPEAILTPEQWEATMAAPGRNGYGTNIEHLHVSDVEALGRELDKRGRLNMMRYSGRP